MGGAQCGAQSMTNLLRDCLNLSRFLLAQCCLRSAQLSVFLLLASLSFLFSVFVFFSLVLPLSVLYSLSLFMALKPIDIMTAGFLFLPHRIACCCSLGVPCLGIIIMAHREWPLVLLQTTLAFTRRFSFLVTLWNESSANSVAKSNVKVLSVVA